MGQIDYSKEPHSDIAFIDMKSFYASVECVKRGLHPLTASLCVMSRSDNSSGLILASSPTFKEVFGKNNVGRSKDLPFDIKTRKFSYEKASRQNIPITREYVKYIEDWAAKTFIVTPRMGLYIEENLKIQKVLKNFAADDEIYPYSIDEGFVDLTSSLDYFIKDKRMSRYEKLDTICSKIQHEIWKSTGVFSTVGMSNANPLLAKLALDNEAKKTKNMRANWSYEDVESKVWNIPNLTDFWGIGGRTAKRLNRLCIYSIRDLANTDPDRLKREFGIIGVQLWFHANGVDESSLSNRYTPESKGIGNSQILPRNYTAQYEIEIVLKEMAEQVATRLRRIHKKATVVGIHVGFSYEEQMRSINTSMKVNPTQSTEELTNHVLTLFRSKYKGGAVRNIGVKYDNLTDESRFVFTIFDDIKAIEKRDKLERAIDHIRDRFGYLSIQKTTSLMEGSRVKERSKLIGGHCGGMDGMI
ncbi:Y-family DNA polymerase [Campylobacter sp. RM16192]|uniref:Y-family DNA polymerase n=1 Tax=Campylobacter sp. RM16192 TaxID=1660080 RepID=UPI001597C7F4|nr:Y-family DNA polymerase [Campylobacter sp. RM16192]QKU36235.1 DNA polymerase [Campylobacter sp. RM16192]